jgi:hypothetical protein
MRRRSLKWMCQQLVSVRDMCQQLVSVRESPGLPEALERATMRRACGTLSPFHAATALASNALASKGRLIRCTVPGLTPNRAAILRTPGRSGAVKCRIDRGPPVNA